MRLSGESRRESRDENAERARGMGHARGRRRPTRYANARSKRSNKNNQISGAVRYALYYRFIEPFYTVRTNAVTEQYALHRATRPTTTRRYFTRPAVVFSIILFSIIFLFSHYVMQFSWPIGSYIRHPIARHVVRRRRDIGHCPTPCAVPTAVHYYVPSRSTQRSVPTAVRPNTLRSSLCTPITRHRTHATRPSLGSSTRCQSAPEHTTAYSCLYCSHHPPTPAAQPRTLRVSLLL